MDQPTVANALDAQFATAERLGAANNPTRSTADYAKARSLVETDRRLLASRFARAATDAQRQREISVGARDVVVAYETMGAGMAPSWVYDLAGIPQSLGVAPAPYPPVGGSSTSAPSTSYALSPRVSGSAAGTFAPRVQLDLGWLAAAVLAWLIGKALDSATDESEGERDGDT